MRPTQTADPTTSTTRSRSTSGSFFARLLSTSQPASPQETIADPVNSSGKRSNQIKKPQAADAVVTPTPSVPIPTTSVIHTTSDPIDSVKNPVPLVHPHSLPEMQDLWGTADCIIPQEQFGPTSFGVYARSSARAKFEEKYRLLGDDDLDDDDAWTEGSSAPVKTEVVAEPLDTTPPTGGPLKITDIECCYAGPYGPATESRVYYPHSQIVYRFSICGLKLDSRNKSRVTSTIRILDSTSGRALDQKVYPATPTLFLGGDQLSGFFTLSLTRKKLPFGLYIIEYTVLDHRTGQTATFCRNIKYEKPTQVVLARINFYADSACSAPVFLTGCKGESRFMKIICEGLTPSGRRIVASKELTKSTNTNQWIEVEYNVRDVETNQVSLRTPITAKIDTKMDTPTPATLEFTFPLKLTKSGRFMMCVSVVDVISNTSQSMEIPFTVIRP